MIGTHTHAISGLGEAPERRLVPLEHVRNIPRRLTPGAPTLDSEMGASREGATGVPGERTWLAGVGDRGPRRADLARWGGRPLPLLHSSRRSTPRPHEAATPPSTAHPHSGAPAGAADSGPHPTAATTR
jgi:hypothetical protein